MGCAAGALHSSPAGSQRNCDCQCRDGPAAQGGPQTTHTRVLVPEQCVLL